MSKRPIQITLQSHNNLKLLSQHGGQPMTWHLEQAIDKYCTPLLKKITKAPPEKASTKFAPPTPNELWEYMGLEKGGTREDCRAFWDHYNSNGWKVGRNGMKCWRSAVNNWLGRKKKEVTNGSLAERRENDTQSILAELDTPEGYDRLLGRDGAPVSAQVGQGGGAGQAQQQIDGEFSVLVREAGGFDR